MPQPTPKVTIVDDDPDMRDSLRWLMLTVGLAVDTFADADDFLRALHPRAPAASCSTCGCRAPAGSTSMNN